MRLIPTLILVIGACACPAMGENWPAWRGPSGDGVSHEKDLPTAWNKANGIAWTASIPEWGDSTPAIWKNAIFVTSNVVDKLLLLKLDKKSGTIEWTREVGTSEATRMPLRKKEGPERSEQKFHQLHNMATPSPVTNGEVVIAHFGNGDLAAYDFSGKQLWKHNLQADHGKYTIWWGHANSPILFDNLVISVCMQDSLADIQQGEPIPSYLVAHDLHTGKERWKTMRMTKATAEECDAYTTPLIAEIAGKRQLVVMGGNQLDAYDPATGKQLWYLPGLVGGRTVTGPLVADDYLFATRGMRGATFALELNDVAKSQSKELDFHSISWKYDQGTPDSCSPVAWGDLLFTVADDGIARCFDLHTGNPKWKERLKGKFKASPIAADRHVYFLSMDGVCTVVAASERFERVSENEIDDAFLASPAVSDGHIYLRGRAKLYCIGK
jgi:outer membrane protein assembly factor BamB